MWSSPPEPGFSAQTLRCWELYKVVGEVFVRKPGGYCPFPEVRTVGPGDDTEGGLDKVAQGRCRHGHRKQVVVFSFIKCFIFHCVFLLKCRNNNFVSFLFSLMCSCADPYS